MIFNLWTYIHNVLIILGEKKAQNVEFMEKFNVNIFKQILLPELV